MFWWCYIPHRLSGEMHSLVHMHNGGGGGSVLWEMAEKRLFGVLS